MYEPLEEGLDVVVNKRQLVTMEILLELEPKEINTDGIGYQEPLPDDEVEEQTLDEILTFRRSGGKRNRGRGG